MDQKCCLSAPANLIPLPVQELSVREFSTRIHGLFKRRGCISARIGLGYAPTIQNQPYDFSSSEPPFHIGCLPVDNTPLDIVKTYTSGDSELRIAMIRALLTEEIMGEYLR